MNKVDGWQVFIASITTFLGHEVSLEATAYLMKVGFFYFGVVTTAAVLTIGALGWWICRQRTGDCLILQVILGAGVIGSLSGILKGLLQ
jgi:hypothetical protein